MIRALAIMIMATAFCITTFMASGAEGQGGASKPGEVFRDCPDCPDMVVVPAGSFQMGSTVEERQSQGVAKIFADREEPLHRVTIAKPFAMSVYEVTRAVYKEFAGATHLTDAPGCAAYDPKTDTWSLQAGVSWHDPGFPQTDKDPAICISWADAHAFAEWLAAKTGKSYRLASEAEWEYAARAGTRTARYWGDAAEPACEKANIMTSATQEKLGWPKSWKNQLICTGDHAFTQPVGSYPPNTFGLYDMLGNAWEWVEDCYHDTYAGAPVDGSAWREAECKARMPRGGAFHSAPWLARAATRGKADPDYRGVASGIRIVRDIK
jgi:formylglycine-generating enzyme required for sulfatase activity